MPRDTSWSHQCGEISAEVEDSREHLFQMISLRSKAKWPPFSSWLNESLLICHFEISRVIKYFHASANYRRRAVARWSYHDIRAMTSPFHHWLHWWVALFIKMSPHRMAKLAWSGASWLCASNQCRFIKSAWYSLISAYEDVKMTINAFIRKWKLSFEKYLSS